MPCAYTNERDPKRWAACRAQIRREMLADGWIERSLKFSEVLTRKALRLYGRTA